MNSFTKIFVVFLLITVASQAVIAQGYLHAEGKNIVNGAGENVILKGIGTGNWMLMEGYMMKTEGFAGTQHEIEAKLIQTIGAEKTKTFFDTWLANHFTKADVDSMKVWGFNSVRVAMHYKWFTLPIEEELNPGNNTWVFKGFQMIDKLLDWCEANQMYLILDLHGAPGGQGANADISDYNPLKPSLWQSQANKDKTVALWRKLAERYSNEPWIGGYDLINETNWTFPEGNNSQMRELFDRITTAIREVDNNHIIFIEGNGFANDFSGLTPPWDNNLVYSFHKYWSGTSSSDLDWTKQLRDAHNVPLWMGESGENSNTWFTDFITTCEKNNIGWSWWPVKKSGINNVLNVTLNKDYEDLVKYWKGEIPIAPSADKAYQAVMKWADNHKIENCKVQYDVIDAMMRQPKTNTVIPYKQHKLNEPIFFSDFDLGKNGFAYSDKVVANYGGEWTAWNTGWELRNDGVDIEKCQDTEDVTNGFNVGWTEKDEWMQYSLTADSAAIYKLKVRYASGSGGSKFHIEVNGADVTGELSLPSTGGWQNWRTSTFENIVVPAGLIKIKYVTTDGSPNLSYFNFFEPKSALLVDFKAVSASTSVDGSEIFIALNKEITNSDIELQFSDFKLEVDGTAINIISVSKDSTASSVLIIKHDTKLYSDKKVAVSYNGTSVKSGKQDLHTFSNLSLVNNLPVTHAIPGKIEAEDFYFNNGLALENCTDIYAGQNTGYAAPGKYLDYEVHVKNAGIYNLDYRVATQQSNSELIFQVGDGEIFTSIDTIKFSGTGGWQTWATQSSQIHLKEGYYYIRLLVKSGEHNLNWFHLDLVTSSEINKMGSTEYRIYPNPAGDILNVDFGHYPDNPVSLKIINMLGIVVREHLITNANKATIKLDGIEKGVYILQISDKELVSGKRFIISS